MSHHDGTHIRFVHSATAPKQKTVSWTVTTKAGAYLGRIRWYGPWRQYAFLPQPMTTFEEDCLREIAAFLEARTQEHRQDVALARFTLKQLREVGATAAAGSRGSRQPSA